MPYDLQDTIAAIGTAPGGALRGMVRLSGPQVLECLADCFQPSDTIELSKVRVATLVPGVIHLANDAAAPLPCDLFLWPTAQSYTRQPTAELHTIGSPPLLEAVLREVCHHGARLAEPGEFTLRAFLAGRLDLTQAEAVLGVIDAHSDAELSSALTQLAGGLSGPLHALREQLLQLLAELEAGLDFVEEDIEFITAEQLTTQLQAAQQTVAATIAQLDGRAATGELPRVVLVGPPNAGKSSLFNALLERFALDPQHARALVSDQSGTTRDFVTAVLRIEGIELELIDTAGIDPAAQLHTIEQLAQSQTEQQRDAATLVIYCEDASEPQTNACVFMGTPDLIAHTKSDLITNKAQLTQKEVPCSSLTGEGITDLAAQIAAQLNQDSPESGVALTAARCDESLQHARQSLAAAQTLVATQAGDELVAAEVRTALHALGQVVGAVYTDDILDRIFGQFCIGK